METENAFFEIYSKKIQGCSLPQAEIKHPPKKWCNLLSKCTISVEPIFWNYTHENISLTLPKAFP